MKEEERHSIVGDSLSKDVEVKHAWYHFDKNTIQRNTGRVRS